MKKVEIISENYEVNGIKRERVIFKLENESYPRKRYDYSTGSKFGEYVDKRIDKLVKSNKYLVMFMTK